jgi:hypothetical protein
MFYQYYKFKKKKKKKVGEMSDLIIDMYGKYLKININTEEYPIVTSLFKIMVEKT